VSLPGVPDHGHCEVCQTPVKAGERFCGSEACLEQHQKNQKEKKLQVYKLVAILAAVILLNYLFRLR